jgi:sugar/nucleoside kinase (ribokinase family)
MKFEFIGLGDIVTDAFIKLKEGIHIDEAHGGHGKAVCLSFGDKIEYEDVTVVPAVGNAPNATVSAHRLGLKTALSSDIGDDDFGEKKLETLKKEGVDISLVEVHEGMQSNYHYVLRYGPERTILIKHQKYPYKLPNLSEPPEWIYFSSIGEHGLDYHHVIAKYVKENGVKLAFQPGSFQISLGAEKLKDVYEASEIFFCNKQEAQRILNSDENDMVKLMEGIRALGPNIAMVTDGPNGAHAMNAEGAWKMPMYPDPAPPVDRTGAGDSFSSTIVCMLQQGLPLPEALMRGPINSMNVVQHVGAQEGLLTRDELEQLLKDAPEKYKLEKIA